MGVGGLLRVLKPIGERRTLDDLQGLRLGVDGYGWLHRAVLTCAEDLVHNRPTTRYLEYIDRRVTQFERHGIQLYFVFDGAALPMKKRVELQRAAARADARASLSTSSSGLGAHRAVDVTPQMAACVCAYLRAKKMPYVVAPYEADPQLVYLEMNGIIDGILSEDSDLLVFGARRLLTKLDSSGMCIEINAEKIRHSSLSALAGPDQLAMLRLLAVVSGCDYSQGIMGYGPVKAAALVAKYRDLDAIIAAVTREGRSVDVDFAETGRRADLAFRHQRVFDPNTRCIVTLTPIESVDGLEDIIGFDQPASEALRIARGVLCPETRQILAVPPHVQQFLSRISRQPLAPLQSNRKIERKVAMALGPRGKEISPFFKKVLKENVPPGFAQPIAPLTPSPKPVTRAVPTPVSTAFTSAKPFFQSQRPRCGDETPAPKTVPITPKTQNAEPNATPNAEPLTPMATPNVVQKSEPPKLDLKRFAYAP